jgi:hypothetical protein
MRHADRFHGTRTGGAMALLAGLLLALPVAAHAQRESGIQLSPQSNRYFISKDVGNERWAITYNLDDKTVTGNVFPIDGGAPTFLTCDITRVEQAPNPADAQYFLSCRASGPCAEAPCTPGQWGTASDAGPIPGSFLLPTGTRATNAGNVQPIYNQSCSTSAVCHANGANYVVLANGVSWANTFLVPADGVNGPQGFFVVPFLPDESFLFEKVADTQGPTGGARMPYNGDPLPDDQIELIRRWILEGAANN